MRPEFAIDAVNAVIDALGPYKDEWSGQDVLQMALFLQEDGKSHPEIGIDQEKLVNAMIYAMKTSLEYRGDKPGDKFYDLVAEANEKTARDWEEVMGLMAEACHIDSEDAGHSCAYSYIIAIREY